MSIRDYLIALAGLLLLGVGSAPCVVGLFLSRYVGPEHGRALIVSYGFFYLVVCAAGVYFTYRNWRHDKAPLLAEIRRLERVLENG